MSWNFRKSKGFGPLRFTLTQRGISSSVGAGPLRFGRGSDGKYRRTVRIPGTGLYNTERIGGGQQTPKQPRKGRTILLVVIGLFLLIAIGKCAGGESEDITSAPASTRNIVVSETYKPAVTSIAPAPPVPSGPTAQQVVDAFTAAGLPVINPRDNTSHICGDLKCVQLITTDEVSVYQFPDQESATRMRDGGLVVTTDYASGPIYLRFAEGGSHGPANPTLVSRYQAVLDSLIFPDVLTPPRPLLETLNDDDSMRPVSTLAPGVMLPHRSVDSAATERPDLEVWAFGGDYRPTAALIAEQMPINQNYDGLAWCTGDDFMGYDVFEPTTQWSWGNATDRLVVTVVTKQRINQSGNAYESGTIFITRGPAPGYDRSDCDVP